MNRAFSLVVVSLLFPITTLVGIFFFLSTNPEAGRTTTIIVNTLDDELNSDGDCSLREAISAATYDTAIDTCPSGSNSITDTISIIVSGTILLTDQLLITDRGPIGITGNNQIIISGENNSRVFYVGISSVLSLSQLTIANGQAADVTIADGNDGGGILSYGYMSIRQCTIQNNYAYTNDNGGDLNISQGGGIANYGTMSIKDSDILINGATTGGGIFNHGRISLEETTVSGNAAEDGAGIWNSDIVEILNSDLRNNVAFYGAWGLGKGGGIGNSGHITISNSILVNNEGFRGGAVSNSNGYIGFLDSEIYLNEAEVGGGIENDGDRGDIVISQSSLTYNSAANGGGVFTNGGSINIFDSSFTGNSAQINGGGMFYTTDDSYGLPGQISGSTFAFNQAASGGALYLSDTFLIINSTFSQNNADHGGGLYTIGGNISITHSTLSGNEADEGSGVYRAGGITGISDSILHHNAGDDNCWGSIIDLGNNIDSGDSCDFVVVNGSRINTDPLVGTLQDNGGATLTYALLAESPAIDMVPVDNCPTIDQRGVYRPQDGDGVGDSLCDAGSFELESEPSVFLYMPIVQIN